VRCGRLCREFSQCCRPWQCVSAGIEEDRVDVHVGDATMPCHVRRKRLEDKKALASLTSPRRRLSVSALGLLEKNSICWWSTLENSSFMAYASAEWATLP
jgi:hypothetical protein